MAKNQMFQSIYTFELASRKHTWRLNIVVTQELFPTHDTALLGRPTISKYCVMANIERWDVSEVGFSKAAMHHRMKFVRSLKRLSDILNSLI